MREDQEAEAIAAVLGGLEGIVQQWRIAGALVLYLTVQIGRVMTEVMPCETVAGVKALHQMMVTGQGTVPVQRGTVLVDSKVQLQMVSPAIVHLLLPIIKLQALQEIHQP